MMKWIISYGGPITVPPGGDGTSPGGKTPPGHTDYLVPITRKGAMCHTLRHCCPLLLLCPSRHSCCVCRLLILPSVPPRR